MSVGRTRVGRGLNIAAAALLLAVGAKVLAVEIAWKPIAPGVYAFVGEKGARSASNEGLNANLGLVVTAQGAVLIDSGATWEGAKQIEQSIASVTPQPVKWVINTGGQDHRWLGNGYFKSKGAQLIAHQASVPDMQARGGDQIQALQAVLGVKAALTVPTLPERLVTSPDETLTLGEVVFELRHRAGAHTPGDMLVWLPGKQVVFTGDIVYTDRMLGVLPVSNSKHWLASVDEIAKLSPKVLVPGHGEVSTLEIAQAQTGQYLRALRAHMKKAVDDGVEMSAAIKSFDLTPFAHLLNASELHPPNASRVYLELERE
jgi:glyoxylase-like metal-dependent hydrolase (beta-lactamase superfamily II)